MKPCLSFPREGDQSSLSRLAAEIDTVWPAETKFKAAMRAAIAKHTADDEDALVAEVRAKLAAWNRYWAYHVV